ncbi:MAG: methyltransferase domain-containing protein, partial [Acidobacteriota bacterium]
LQALARWLHGLFKAPARIRDLYGFHLESVAERVALRHRLEDLEAAAVEMTGRSSGLEQKLAALEVSVQESSRDLGRQVEGLLSREAGTRSVVKRLAGGIEEGRKASSLLETRFRQVAASLEEGISRLQESLQELKAGASGARARLDRLAGSIEEEKRTSLSLRKRLRCLESVLERLEERERTVQRMEGTLVRLESRAMDGQRRLEEVAASLDGWKEEERVRGTEMGRLKTRVEEMKMDLGLPGGDRHVLDEFYQELENRFRGDPELIRGRQRIYLPILTRAGLGAGSRPVLDLGCGRGEWLGLLKEAGLRGHGLDINSSALAHCRLQGLSVQEADATTHLQTLEAGSVDAVTAFHLVEHLPFRRVLALLKQVERVLAPGGLLILETPNPANLMVSSFSFHLDPTHQTLLPHPLLAYMVESSGLERAEVRPLHPEEEEGRLSRELDRRVRSVKSGRTGGPDSVSPAAAPGSGTSQELPEPATLGVLLAGPRDYAVTAWKVES